MLLDLGEVFIPLDVWIARSLRSLLHSLMLFSFASFVNILFIEPKFAIGAAYTTSRKPVL
jgi:hypothetical protein